MAEKDVTKKLLILLLVLVVLSLVADLFSLNVLYNIADRSGLKGSLAESAYVRFYDYSYPYGSGCDVLFSYDFGSSSCVNDCVYSRASCTYYACVEEFDCEKDGYAMPGFCSSQRDLEEQTCDVRYENCNTLCS